MMRRILVFAFVVMFLGGKAQEQERLQQKQSDLVKYFLKEFIKEKYHNAANRELVLKENGFELEKESIQNQERNLDQDLLLQEGAEPHIAINPNDENHIVVTFMDLSNGLNFPVYYSFDGGQTFTQSVYSVVESFKSYNSIYGEIENGGDPILAFDNGGKLYLSWLIVYDNVGTTGLVSSVDGGITFSDVDSESIVYSGSSMQMEVLDREWLAVDNSEGANDGTLYMSGFYLGQTLNTNGQIVLTKPYGSNVFNQTVSSASGFDMNGNTAPQFGNIKVDDYGNVHVSCMQYSPQDGNGTIIYSKSTDGANSFTETELSGNMTQAYGNAVLHDRENAAVSMDVDGNNIYMTWTDFSNNDITAFYAYSSNNGDDWSVPVNLNTLLGTDKYYLMPNVAADNGKMALSFFAVDKVSKTGTYYMCSSDDMGQTLNTAVELSGLATDFQTIGEEEFMGDYNTSIMHDCHVYSVWAAKDNSQINLYLSKTNVCDATGIVEYTTVNSSFYLLDTYPNPVKNQFNIKIVSEKRQKLNINILTTTGVIVKEFSLNILKDTQEITSDLAGLDSGHYILRIFNSEGEVVSKSIFKE